MYRRTIPTLALLVLAACSGARTASDQPGAAAAPSMPPLAALVGQPLIILPVRYLAAGDSLGWGAQAGPATTYLREVDRAIAAALTARGVASSWMLAEGLIQSARRNPTSMPDPTLLPADRLRGRLTGGNMVGEPLASQLRALSAIGGSRLALVPVELRFVNAAGGARPELRLVLIDTRTSMIRLALDAGGEAQSSFSPALLASIAGRVADLFAAP